MSFRLSWHPTMHASEPRLVLNMANCELCGGQFQQDSVGILVCDRQICRSVRIFAAIELERDNTRIKMQGQKRKNGARMAVKR